MSKSVEIISSILACLPDKSQNASRLLFTSMTIIAKEIPNKTVEYIIEGFDSFGKEKHEVIFELLTELFHDDNECISPGQSSQLISLTTAELSQNRLDFIGSLCCKYQSEIVDHLLSSIGPHTLSYMTRVADQVDLPSELLIRLIAGSLPYFSKLVTKSEQIDCCKFVTQIMKNYCEKKTTDPFLDTVFDPLYYSLMTWQNIKPQIDLDLRNRVLEAIAWLCHGLPWNRYDELVKLVKIFQSVIIKSPELLEPFYQLILICAYKNPRPLLDLLENLLIDLFRCFNITTSSDTFRCLGVLTSTFPTQVLDFIIRRIDTLPGTASVRVKSLKVIQYLINYETEIIKENLGIIMPALLRLQSSTSLLIRLQLLNVGQALLSNQLLETNDLASRQVIEFIIRMASMPSTSPDSLKLRQAAQSIFQLSSSASAETRNFLWPILLSFLAAPAYHQAAGCVAKALEMITIRQLQETRPLELPPKPPQPVLFVRCVLFLSSPKETEPGALLSFLQYLAKSVHAELDAIFRVVLPRLDEYLAKNLHSTGWSQTEWHELLLKLVIRSLSVMDSGTFLAKVRTEIAASLSCHQSIRCRPFMLQCSAAALAATPDSKFILNGIDQLFTVTIHENPAERIACSRALELLSMSKHFDAVVERFLSTCRGKISKKDNQMIRVIFGAAGREKENFKCTVFLGLTRIFNIMTTTSNFKFYLKTTQFLVEFNSHVDMETLKAYFECIAACSIASKHSGIHFLGRNEILTLLCREILPQESYSALHPLVIDTLANLIVSKPDLTQSDGGEIIRFGLSISSSNSFIVGYLEALTDLFGACLQLDKTQNNLFNLLMSVHNWMISSIVMNRQAATHIWLSLLTEYRNFGHTKDINFDFINELMSPIAVRCTDSNLAVRQQAIDCAKLIFGLVYGCEMSITVDVQSRLLSTEIETVYDGVTKFGEILSQFVTNGFSFILSLIEFLTDHDEQSSNGAVLFLNIIIRTHIIQHQSEMSQFIKQLLSKLRLIEGRRRSKCHAGILSLFVIAATQQPLMFIDELLENSCSLTDHVTIVGDIWKQLGSQGITSHIFWEIVENKLVTAQPFAIGPGFAGTRRSATVKIIDRRFLSLVSAARQMCPCISPEYLIKRLPKSITLYLTLWTVLIDSMLPVTFAATAKSANLTPSIIMADLIKCFLQRSKFLAAAKKTSGLPNSITSERITTQDVCNGLRSILESIGSEDRSLLTQITEIILSDLSKNGFNDWESDLCKISLLSDSLKIYTKSMTDHQNEEVSEHFSKIIIQLIAVCKTKRSHATLKLITLNGFGTLCFPTDLSVFPNLITIINSLLELFIEMLSADSDDIILSETLKTTQKLLQNVPYAPLANYSGDLFSTCRSFSTRTNNVTRRNAFELMAQLSINLDEVSNFNYEVNESLFLVLISLADQDEDVRLAAQRVLINFKPVFSEKCRDLIVKHAGKLRLHTGEFTSEIVSRMTHSMGNDLVNQMFESCEISLSNSNCHIRGQTATIIASIAKSYPDKSDLKSAASKLIPLLLKGLKDESPDNRAKSAEALSFLHSLS